MKLPFLISQKIKSVLKKPSSAVLQEIKKGAFLHSPKEAPFIGSNLCRSTGIFWELVFTACNFTP
jgi:hypothetical protein